MATATDQSLRITNVGLKASQAQVARQSAIRHRHAATQQRQAARIAAQTSRLQNKASRFAINNPYITPGSGIAATTGDYTGPTSNAYYGGGDIGTVDGGGVVTVPDTTTQTLIQPPDSMPINKSTTKGKTIFGLPIVTVVLIGGVGLVGLFFFLRR